MSEFQVSVPASDAEAERSHLLQRDLAAPLATAPRKPGMEQDADLGEPTLLSRTSIPQGRRSLFRR